MDPAGTMLLNGLASEGTFLGDALDKYGVGIQVVRVGEFKGAVEPLTSSGFSEENRMQVSRLLDLRWSNYLSSIIENRSLSVDLSDLNETLKSNYLFEPAKAKEKGFVDFISPINEMLDRLESQGKLDPDSGEYAKVSLLDYLARPSSPSVMEEKMNNGVPKVAVLYVEGAITDGWSDDGLVDRLVALERIRIRWLRSRRLTRPVLRAQLDVGDQQLCSTAVLQRGQHPDQPVHG